jgi:D-glycero-D-manno-heptose 1,7-bisphosphate phosphatase
LGGEEAGVRAVFFDRDGTLMEETGYCADPKLVRVFPGVTEALRELRAAGFRIIVATNQAGIAHGIMTDADYQAVHAEFLRQIGPDLIDATYYCADHPDAASARRKPEPGMLLEGAAEFGIDLARSYMVGDRASDVECGRRAGSTAILVLTGYGTSEEPADFVAPDAVSAARWILGRA